MDPGTGAGATMKWRSRPLPASGETGKRSGAVRVSPKPKEGRRFRQPSGVAICSLAHPGDGRAAAAAGSVPLPARDCGTLRSSGRVASAGRSPGRGRIRRAAFPPRCPCDPFLPCGALASRSGHRSTRSRRSFRSITSLRSCCPRASSSVAAVAASSWPCPKAPPLRCNPLHPVRRRALRPWLPARFVARRLQPLPVRLSPPARSPGVPLDACPFRSRLVDANIAPAVSRGGVPVPIHAVSRRHLHGPGRDKHLISLWFPAAASSACLMMLSWFSSRAKRRSTVTICG